MMLRPSYNDLIKAANKYSGHPENPTVQSRYSIVIASAKRARQIVAGMDPEQDDDGRKPLSMAIDEIYQGKVQILSDEETTEADN